jgi:cytochrome P450
MALDPRRAARLSPVDITTAAFAHNPLPGYAELRAKCPVSWHRAVRCWAIARHADAALLLRDPRLNHFGILSSWTRLKERYGIDFPSTIHIVSHMPFNYEGERHAVLRRAIARAIAPLADENQHFRGTVDKLLVHPLASGGFDLAEDYASRILFEIVCDLAEIPTSDRSALYPMGRLSWAIDTSLSIPKRELIENILRESNAYLLAETRRQIARGSRSLIDRIYRELPAGDDEGRLASTAALLSVILVMGNDGIGGTVARAVDALLAPAGGRSAIPQKDWIAASDDALRYTAPVDFLTRVPTEDILVDGMTIRAGEVILISPLSANHDTSEFGEDADAVSATRNQGVGLAFGAGAHLCVGMRMTRNIVREAFAALAAMPRLRLAGPYRPTAGIVVRTAASLPVVID